jgi:hypothetical protein
MSGDSLINPLEFSAKDAITKPMDKFRAMSAWIIGCLVVLLSYGLWSLDRGLDLSDESYYLAAAINPDAVLLWSTAMHWFTAKLWLISGGLSGFRALGMLILTGSALVLALGATHAFQSSGIGVKRLSSRPLLLISACSLCAALLYQAFLPFTPSYNLLAVSCAYLALGLVCLTANRPQNQRCYWLWISAGAALGIGFLAKFSAAGCAYLIACMVAGVLGAARRERLLSITLLSISMALTITALVLWQSNFSEALAQFRLGAEVYLLSSNETVASRMVRYFQQSSDFLRLIFTDFGIPLLLFGLHALRAYAWCLPAGLAAYVYAVLGADFWLGGMDQYQRQIAPLLVAVLLALLVTARMWRPNRRAIGLLAALLLLPFCVAIGTYNALHTQILFSLAPWGVLVGLLAFALPRAPQVRATATLICGLFLTIVASQVVTNGFRAPYRLYRPLSEQTETVTLPALGTFKLDRETRDSYLKLLQLADACGIHPGQNFLGFYNIPGVALILQAIPLGMPLLQDGPSTEPILTHLPPELVKSAIVGINENSGSFDPSLPQQLAGFPGGYRSCGSVVFPFQQQKVELWVRA